MSKKNIMHILKLLETDKEKIIMLVIKLEKDGVVSLVLFNTEN
jgi:hypothetical protein